jgi:hypothetical protein
LPASSRESILDRDFRVLVAPIDRPALLHREVAEETLDGMNADGAVELLAIATGFARVK